MPFTRACATIAASVVLAAGMAASASAQMFISTGKDTLRDLPGVEVAVEQLQPELERGGLTAADIRAEVVRRLRAGGIVVYGRQGENPSRAKPYIYVDVNGAGPGAQNQYAVAVQVQLRQTVMSTVTTSRIVDAMTWDARTVLLVPGNSLAQVRTTIAEYVDHFIGDWRAVHP